MECSFLVDVVLVGFAVQLLTLVRTGSLPDNNVLCVHPCLGKAVFSVEVNLNY